MMACGSRKRYRACTRLAWALFWTLLVSLLCCRSPAEETPVGDHVKADERVIFFPTSGARDPDRDVWTLHVHGWIFEPEQDSFFRDQVTALVESYFEEDVMNDTRRKRLNRRLRYFIADNEGGKELAIQIAGKKILLPESDGDGRFETEITLAADRVEKHAQNGRLTFRVVPGKSGNERIPEGTIHLIEPEGLTVISDIDDTIKISNVRNRTELLRNSFLRSYNPVPGMAAKYRNWAHEKNARFIYLSSSPWQLYPPLNRFTTSQKFPAGPFDLLRVQLDDTRLLNLFDESRNKKFSRLKSYFTRYPDRTFILIGDAGEADADIYADVARAHPDQVQAIFIRNVGGVSPHAERFQKTFEGLPDTRWSVFDDPTELKLAD